MEIDGFASVVGSLSQDDEGKGSVNSSNFGTNRRMLQEPKPKLNNALVCESWAGPRVTSRIWYPRARFQMRIFGVYIPIKPT
jgi:hypothetical protein